MPFNDPYETFTSLANCEQAVAILDANLGFPREGTTTWATPKKAINSELWIFKSFPQEGWNDSRGVFYSYEQATAGLDQVPTRVVQEKDPAWFPSITGA